MVLTEGLFLMANDHIYHTLYPLIALSNGDTEGGDPAAKNAHIRHETNTNRVRLPCQHQHAQHSPRQRPVSRDPLSFPPLLPTCHHGPAVPRVLLTAGGGSFSPAAARACSRAPAAHCGRHDSAGDRPHRHDPASAQGAAPALQQPSGCGPVHHADHLPEAAQEPATRPAHLLHPATGHDPQIRGAPQQCCCCCFEVVRQSAAAQQLPVHTFSPLLACSPGWRQLQAHAFSLAATAVTAVSVSRRERHASCCTPQAAAAESAVCASSTVTREGVTAAVSCAVFAAASAARAGCRGDRHCRQDRWRDQHASHHTHHRRLRPHAAAAVQMQRRLAPGGLPVADSVAA